LLKQQLERNKADVLAELFNDRDFRLIDDTIAELDDWDCFNEDDADDYDDLENDDEDELIGFNDEPVNEVRAPQQEPYRHENKVGRNDPCPCGSGKKYKKCCGN